METSMSSDAASTTDAAGHRPKGRGLTHHHTGSKTPPTPPGSPVDRPMPASTTICKDVLGMIREEGDGCRHSKLRSKTTKKSTAFHRSTDNTDQPPREPSDGYQVLDDVPGEAPDGTSSDQHQHHQQQQQPGASSTSDSDDDNSEFDWSEDDDDADSSDIDNSVDEGKRPARDAADGMSSDSESECLI